MKTKVTTVGDKVKLKKYNLVGVVRFIGEVQGKKGIFYGVELDHKKGKNNGSVAKLRYFKCAKKKGLFVKKTGIAKTNTKNNKNAPRVTVGDIVKVTKRKCKGTIRFIGTPYSVRDKGIFYGIELVKPKGKNNGIVKNRRYFTCKHKYGIFVQAAGFSALSLNSSLKGGKKKKKKKENETKDDTKEEEEKKEEEENKEDIEYKVGDHVMIKPDRKGQIKWIGEEKEFGTGSYYGIRLTEKRGDNDGKWKDVRKFQCPQRFGVYIPLRLIVKRVDGDFDFMNEEQKYEEEARIKAEEFKKERDKLQRFSQRISKHKILSMKNNELSMKSNESIKHEKDKSKEKQDDDDNIMENTHRLISNMNLTNFTDSDCRETANYLKTQCFNAISDGFFDESFIMIATIGRNNNINIVPLLFDIYSFYKYKTPGNVNITHSNFCNQSFILTKLRERDEKHSKIYCNIVSTLGTFNHRHHLNPPFNPNSFVKIDDNINEYIQYTLYVSTMLNNIIRNNSLCLPLLIDLWIIPKNIKTVLNVEYDEYDESDDDEYEEEEEGNTNLTVSFEENLKKYGAIYEVNSIECKSKIQCIEKLENSFKKILNKNQRSIKICIIIDKRKEKNNLLIYQLPLKYSTIPRNYCIETLIYSSSQHIMYDIDNSVLKQRRTINDNNNNNINDPIFGAKYDCNGQMFCLSFALNERNMNRIQFWMNGGGIRFWPQYMINIWPKLFVNQNIDKKYTENEYIKNNFNLSIKDPLFDAWYRDIVDF